MQAELGSLDSQFFERFAAAGWPDALGLLETYCLGRFDRAADYLRPLAAAADAAAINILQGTLESQETVALEFASKVLGGLAEPLRGEFLSRLRTLLKARTLAHVAEAREAQYDLLLADSRSNLKVTKAVIDRRKRIVRAYRRQHELTTIGFALKLGLDKSTISGIIREDFNRAGAAAQRDLLNFLGVTRDDWYSEE